MDFEDTIKVNKVIEHEDGSATFEFEMDEATKNILYGAFIKGAITNGIKAEEMKTDEWVWRQRFIAASTEFFEMATRWMEGEELDWDPHVLPAYNKVKELYDARKESQE